MRARMVTTAGHPLKADGTIPQTTAIPFVTRRYSSGPLNVAAHSPEFSQGDGNMPFCAPPTNRTEGIVSIQNGGSVSVISLVTRGAVAFARESDHCCHTVPWRNDSLGQRIFPMSAARQTRGWPNMPTPGLNISACRMNGTRTLSTPISGIPAKKQR